MSITLFQPSSVNLKKRKNLEGKRYGRLLVLRWAGRDKRKQTCYECLCDCGTIKIFRAVNISRGTSRSCGCLRREMTIKRNFEHGLTDTPEHLCWQLMNRRCYVTHCREYALYGGRGIKICSRWKNSFLSFLKDMGKKPSKKHSIDRMDNSKGYTPSNCRWATPKEQANNKRTNRFLECDGKRMTVMQWSEYLGIPNSRIRMRLNYGYTTEQAITLKRYELR